jgi:lactoylglutathione lyase
MLPTTVGAITLFVDDPQRSKAFYADLFNLSVIYEDESAATFKFDNMLVNLLESSGAEDLVAPGVVGDREAGPRFQLTIWVEDADAACADLRAHGVELLNGPMDREWGVRTAAFADPDGHVWEIAQPLPEKAES